MNRKIIITCLVLSLFAIQYSHAQIRHIDLNVAMDDKIANDTVYSPGNLSVTGYIINNGPDSIFRGDGIYLEYMFGNQYYGIQYISCPKNLAVGDTLANTQSLGLFFKPNVFNITTCAIANMVGSARDSIIPETKAQLKNNKGCQPINHISNYPTKNSKIYQNSANMYPNPTSDKLIIDNITNVTVEVYNHLGKTLIKESTVGDGKNQLTLDVSQWKVGIYIIKLNHDGVTQTLKFEKN